MIEKAVAHLQLQAETHGVTIATEVSPTLPLVPADADRIGQVFGNLLSNALRYTPTGGRITVCAFAEVERNTESVVVVEVTDTGSGIAPADLPYVFDRFYRADSRAPGLAAALALVWRLSNSWWRRTGGISPPNRTWPTRASPLPSPCRIGTENAVSISVRSGLFFQKSTFLIP